LGRICLSVSFLYIACVINHYVFLRRWEKRDYGCSSGYKKLHHRQMTIFDKYRDFEFDRNKNKIFGIKSGIIWGHSRKINSISPLVYISKPKHVSQEEFDEILEKIRISFVK
jgi:hypothetical protein